MSERKYAQQVAGEVRAEMARKGHGVADLAVALNFKTVGTARSRYEGKTPFNLIELARVAAWLGVPVMRLASAEHEAAAS